jgi:hypothetical protein
MNKLTTGCNKGEHEGEQVTIVYRRKADYSKDPFKQRPPSPYIKELFERSDRAIKELKREE